MLLTNLLLVKMKIANTEIFLIFKELLESISQLMRFDYSKQVFERNFGIFINKNIKILKKLANRVRLFLEINEGQRSKLF